MASDFDDIMFEVESGLGEAESRVTGRPNRFDPLQRYSNTAQPFSAEELAEFEASGEHAGLV
jgi:hypothetical protein